MHQLLSSFYFHSAGVVGRSEEEVKRKGKCKARRNRGAEGTVYERAKQDSEPKVS